MSSVSLPVISDMWQSAELVDLPSDNAATSSCYNSAAAAKRMTATKRMPASAPLPGHPVDYKSLAQVCMVGAAIFSVAAVACIRR